MRFVNFIGKYQKKYATKEEFMHRLEIFTSNLNKIESINSMNG